MHDILIHTPKTEADVEQSLTEINENPIDYYPLDFFRNVYYFHELGLDYTKKNWFGKPSIPEKP